MSTHFHACNCIGPQNGQPRCPCAMRGVIVRDGRYIQPEVDLGPATVIPSASIGDMMARDLAAFGFVVTRTREDGTLEYLSLTDVTK